MSQEPQLPPASPPPPTPSGEPPSEPPREASSASDAPPPRAVPQALDAVHGWLWMAHGARLFRPYPLFWILLLFFYWLGLSFIATVPLIGAYLALALVPGVSAGFFIAAQATQGGQVPLPRHLFLPFKERAREHLKLGLFYIAGLVLVIGATIPFDGGTLFKALILGGKLKIADLDKPEIRAAATAAMVFYAPLGLTFWFAPALVQWHGQSAGKSLFFSVAAVWRNKAPFLIYFTAAGIMIGVIPVLLGALFGLVAGGSAGSRTALNLMLFPYMLMMICIIFASLYSSYIGVFNPAKQAETPAPEDASPPPPPPPPSSNS
jgi:hypothetical protein